jgi:hypothetical protein
MIGELQEGPVRESSNTPINLDTDYNPPRRCMNE